MAACRIVWARCWRMVAITEVRREPKMVWNHSWRNWVTNIEQIVTHQVISCGDCCCVRRVVQVGAKVKGITLEVLLLIMVRQGYRVVTLAIPLLIVLYRGVIRVINNLLICSICVHVSSRYSNGGDDFSIWTYCLYRSCCFLNSCEIIFELLLLFRILVLLSRSLINRASGIQSILSILRADWLLMIVWWIRWRNQILKLWRLRKVSVIHLAFKKSSTTFSGTPSHILWVFPNRVIFRWLRPIRYIPSVIRLFRVIEAISVNPECF